VTEERDVLAYVNATVALDLMRRRQLYGERHAVPLPASRDGDCPPTAGRVESADRSPADEMPAHGLRPTAELPETESGLLASAGYGDACPEAQVTPDQQKAAWQKCKDACAEDYANEAL
jgi:hypothetical protein